MFLWTFIMPSKRELKMYNGDLQAYCFSFRCLGNIMMAKGVKKDVHFHVDLCPDCKGLLVWKKLKRTYCVRKKSENRKDF